MPELPDITIYIESLSRCALGQVLRNARVASPFVLRTVDPAITAIEGCRLDGIERIGKRIVLVFDSGLFLVFHLMIAGRLQWRTSGGKIPKRLGLAAFDFEVGTLLLTEAGSRKRASLSLFAGRDALEALDPGGVEPLTIDCKAFGVLLTRENHTLKRALTDPRILSGIGNAYSDEILHRAGLSPLKLTHRLSNEEIVRLHLSMQAVLIEWCDRLRAETGEGWPTKVTAFREEMAVHGRYGKPCPVCGTPVKRIVYAENETNYCARCQTEGKVLRDRALSRLLRDDWPRNLDELSEAEE